MGLIAVIAICVLLILNVLVLLKLQRWLIDPRRAGLSWAAVLIGNPVVLLAAIDYLVIDNLSLSSGSRAAAWRQRSMRVNHGGYFITVYEDPQNGTHAWSYNAPKSIPPPTVESERMNVLMFNPLHTGWWGLEKRKLTYMAHTLPADGGPEDSSLRTPEACAFVADFVVTNDLELFEGHAAGIRAGKTIEYEILWPGVVRTALAVSVALLGVSTAALVPRWNRRRLVAFDAKWCLKCRYPREGIEAERCPECGVGFLS